MESYEPGWYTVEGDPPDTMRFWDGEQLVGDAVPQDAEFVTHGDLWARGLARFFDWLFVWIALLVIIPFLGGDLLRVAVASIVAVGYEVAFIASRGATPGKMMFNLLVVDKNQTSPPGWVVATRRAVPVWIALVLLDRLVPSDDLFGAGELFVSVGLGIVQLVPIIFTPRHSSFYDLTAGTTVVASAQPASNPT